MASAAPKQPYDYYAVLDFEATCWEGKTKGEPSRDAMEIIEFPTVFYDAVSGRRCDEMEFASFVRPELHPKLSPFCRQLTSIRQDQVDGAPLFADVLQQHTAHLNDHVFAQGKTCVFVTCGDWDLKTMLPLQLRRLNIAVPTYFREWVNIKKVFNRVTGANAKGMDNMLRELGLPLVGTHHRGIDDSRNICSILTALMSRGATVTATFTSGASASGSEEAGPSRKGKGKKGKGAVAAATSASQSHPTTDSASSSLPSLPICAAPTENRFEMIDIGSNLTHHPLDGTHTESVLARANAVGVSRVIATGTSVKGSRACALLTERFAGRVFSTAGVHPHDAKTCNATTLSTLEELARKPGVVAIGECGLDYDRNFSPPAVQREWFRHQVALAVRLRMPLFLHERCAFDDLVAILDEFKDSLPPTVIHCFTGSSEHMRAYCQRGFYIGITGWICDERRGATLRSVVAEIPNDRLMIETDAPFLAPRNVRPKVRHNEPALLPCVVDAIALSTGETPECVAARALENTRRFFAL